MTTNPENKTFPPALLYWVLGIVAIVAGLALSIGQQDNATPPSLESATLLLPPRETAAITLTDQNGKAFGPEQLQGTYNFMFFGYTHCPDICPATLFQFKTMAKLLTAYPKLKAKTRFILVSIDPHRDTPEHLKEYVEYYHPDFIGLTGSAEDIKTYSRQMGVIYERRDSEDDENKDQYLVDHSSAILLTNPAGQLQAVFSAPHNADRLIKDYQAIFNYLEQAS